MKGHFLLHMHLTTLNETMVEPNLGYYINDNNLKIK
jgi:hypothetical protein